MDINDINILLEPYQPWQISFVIAFVIAIILIVILLVATVKLLLMVSDKDQIFPASKNAGRKRFLNQIGEGAT
jgi:flagellar basal body-associated protein FliL